MTTELKTKRLRYREPLIGKNLYIEFPNMSADPFTAAKGGQLLAAVCGSMQVRTSKCVTSYDAKRKVATIMFHYSRPSWATVAIERIEAMQTLFAGSNLRVEDVAPPSFKELGLDQAV